mmetsp:Transcript_9554/g.25064  ORF Transcript_9554/g.25064 Transcript_9554/m.25064 type:complete len:308 (+) Transcript_9554:2-925(+)
MNSIRHPALVETFHIFDEGDKVHFAMELVPGGDLFDVISKNSAFSEDVARDVMKSVLDALAYLHSHHIVHRDLKPENILCQSSQPPYRIKISDFGTAKFITPEMTERSLLATDVGTIFYMAPEMLMNKAQTTAVDLWACGVLLFAMLAGVMPFDLDSEQTYVQGVIEGKIQFGPEWNSISSEAQAFVLRLLAANPAHRPTAKDALHDPWLDPTAAPLGPPSPAKDRERPATARPIAGAGALVDRSSLARVSRPSLRRSGASAFSSFKEIVDYSNVVSMQMPALDQITLGDDELEELKREISAEMGDS